MKRLAIAVLLLTGLLGLGGDDSRPQRKFLLDFGANDGQSAEYFLGKVRKNHAVSQQGGKTTSPLFRMGVDGAWEIHLLEANPRFYDSLLRTSRMLKEINPLLKVTVYNGTAISTADGLATFYLDNPIGREGSSLLATHRGAHPITVKTLSVSRLFMDLNIYLGDIVVLKMDIEGAEFPVLIEIISKGLLSLVDYLAVEWHDTNPFMGWSSDEKSRLSSQRRCIEMILEKSSTTVILWE